MLIKDVGEVKLIRRVAKDFRLDSSVVMGSGDDAAVIKWTNDKYQLLTCDMVVEGVHFDRKAKPFGIGWKALARNVSDIAAMGGVPRHALVSIALSPRKDVRYFDGICKGIKAVADRFGVNIVGGDMSHAQKTIIDIAVMGEVEKGSLVTRGGARKGDLIFVTGSLGGSIKGKHLSFMPRVSEARTLVKSFKVNAMIDISDGLELDLWRVLEASGVGAKVHESLIPLSGEARSFEDALTSGEDFELLFTMNISESRKFFKSLFKKMKTPVTMIGEIVPKKDGYHLIKEDGRKLRLGPKGYLHF